MDTLQGKNALITGAGRGIGKRLAIGLAAAGVRVGLLARSKAELDLARLEIEHAGSAALRIRADVCDYEQVVAAVDRMRVQFGGIDILICAAAMQGPIGPLTQNPVKNWAETIMTDLIGVMHCCRATLPGMMEHRRGKIIVLSGPGGANPRPNFSAYAAAKAGVVRMVETLAEEYGEFNIQLNCMAPGASYTHMTDELIRAGDVAGWKEQEEAAQVRLTGGVSADKQTQLAMFLASERSNHVNGKLIHVNDDWKKLEHHSLSADIYTLRRVQLRNG